MNHFSNLYEEIAEAVPGEPPSFKQLIKLVRDLADDPEQPVQIPDWLAGQLLREVTDEPAFRNAEIAARAGLLE